MSLVASARSRMALVLVTLGLQLGASGGLRADAYDPDAEYDSLRNATRSATSGTGTAPGRAMGNDAAVAGQPGFTQAGSTPADKTPWSGTWWPRKPVEMSFMAFSQGLAPLEKYDTIVYNNYGKNPGSAAWEADPYNRHNDAGNGQNIDWSGHCNGLAASAILEAEPRTPILINLTSQRPVALKLNIQSAYAAKSGLFTDSTADYQAYSMSSPQIQLTVPDMKAMLAECYMNVYTMQFSNKDLLGQRYNRPDVDIYDPVYRDIHPHYFHYLLQAFVKNKGQAFVVEVDPGFPVNNHPLFRYESSSVYYPSLRKYSVTTRVWLADYALSYQAVGTNAQELTYTYDLLLDASGRVYWGEWTGSSVYSHPDFVWIPTAVAAPYSNYTNTSLSYQFVKHLVKGAQGTAR